MERNKLQPLNEVEKKFAEENHPLVYDFLHRYGYSIEDFYNIVIFGYLRAVQVYHRKEKLKEQYPFAFIAKMYMKTEIKNHFTSLNAKKRKPMEPTISLDAKYCDDEDLYNCMGCGSLDDEILIAETMMELLHNVTDTQRKIIEMKMEGYENKEVYLILKIRPSTYYKELHIIKATLEKMID